MKVSLRKQMRKEAEFAKRGEKVVWLAAMSGFVLLSVLLFSVINNVFGLVAVKEAVHPETLVADGRDLSQLSSVELSTILQTNLSKGRMQALLLADILPADLDRKKLGTDPIGSFLSDSFKIAEEVRQKKFAELTSEDIGTILSDNLSQSKLVDEVNVQIVGLEIIQSWPFLVSLFDPGSIAKEVEQKANGINLPKSFDQKQIDQIKADYSAVRIEWKSWLNWNFIVGDSTGNPGDTGIRSAIIGSLLILLIAIVPSSIIGIGTAIFYTEYLRFSYGRRSTMTMLLIELNNTSLAGVSSVLFGLFGLTVYANLMEPITSGAIFGLSAGNGRTVVTAGLTIGTLILPLITISSIVALLSVPDEIRFKSKGIGAGTAQTTIFQVLPVAAPGILTGIILALSRAMGEAAPLIVIGAYVYVSQDPGLFRPYTTLPIQIYNWAAQPSDLLRNNASAGVIVLVAVMILTAGTAIYFRSKFARRLE